LAAHVNVVVLLPSPNDMAPFLHLGKDGGVVLDLVVHPALREVEFVATQRHDADACHRDIESHSKGVTDVLALWDLEGPVLLVGPIHTLDACGDADGDDLSGRGCYNGS